MTKARSHPGFTLLELVLVLVVLVIALSVTAPNLRGWSRGQVLRNAAEQFVAMTNRARSLSVSEMRMYRIEIDANAGLYQLTMQENQAFVTSATTWGRPVELPAGVTMRFGKQSPGTDEPDADAYTSTVRFYPTGRTEPATVTFTAEAGGAITVQCDSPAGGFAMVGGTR
jgi:type II secretion system protein H